MDPDKLTKLRAWLRQSDDRDFAAVDIKRGYIVLQEERGNSAATDSRRVASCSKAVGATVLAIASEQSQQGRLPRKMSFNDHVFEFIPWAKPRPSCSSPKSARGVGFTQATPTPERHQLSSRSQMQRCWMR
jgi:hypothetical protein